MKKIKGGIRKKTIEKVTIFLNACNNLAVNNEILTGDKKINQLAFQCNVANDVFYHAINLGFFNYKRKACYVSNIQLFDSSHAISCINERSKKLQEKAERELYYSEQKNIKDIKSVPDEITLIFPEGKSQEENTINTFDILSENPSDKAIKTIKSLPNKIIKQKNIIPNNLPKSPTKKSRSLNIFWGLIKFNW